jgi:hypothetical protein
METYKKYPLNQKLSKAQVLETMKECGAILTKHYGVYSYWDLTYPDGTHHYNIRENACNSLFNYPDLEIINRDKKGFSFIHK